MTETRRAGRHSAAAGSPATAPADPAEDAVWVPPPFEPARPGDFVEYSSAGFEVRRSHRGLVALLLVLLLAAAGGGWWYLHRDSSSPAAMTCQSVYTALPAPVQHYLRVSDGGSVPAGIPVPAGQPGRTCTVSATSGSGVLVVWPGASGSEYATLLGAGGWTSAAAADGYTRFVNGGDRRDVVTTTVAGQLVALYDD